MSCHLRLLVPHTEKSILCASHPEHNGVVFLGFDCLAMQKHWSCEDVSMNFWLGLYVTAGAHRVNEGGST